MNNLFFIILISPYPTGQPARLEEYFRKKINAKRTLAQGRGYLRQEHFSIVPPSITPFDSSPPFESVFFK